MSSTKATQRRLSLLAGSSLAAATIAAAVFAGAVMAPTAAMAANECTPVGVDPSVNGSAADSYTCSTTPFATGITYNSDGDLTVTKTNTNTTTVTANGVNLTGSGADSLTWNSIAGRVNGGAGTNGPVIDVTSNAGDISIATTSVGATAATTTHAIRATSTGGGGITIAATGQVIATGAGGIAAIEAVSSGGDVTVTTYASGNFFDGTTGRLRGILAQTSDAGDLTLNLGTNVSTVRALGTGGAVIETSAGAGETSINITGGNISTGTSSLDSSRDPNGLVIRAASTSTSATAVNVQNSGGIVYGSVDFSGVTSGGVNFTNSASGYWQAGGASVFGAGADTLTFDSDLQETITSGMPQNRVIAGASIDFGAGDDLLDVQTGLNVGGVLDFGAGTDTLNNDGILSIDGLVTFPNLEVFSNSGTLYLGSPTQLGAVDFFNGDSAGDDILTMEGTTFTGSGTSRIVAAVHFDTSVQEGCASPTGAGDCLYLPGGTTAGSTLLTLVNAGDPATQGGYNGVGVTVVDVAGGMSAASHFSLDPNSEGYRVDTTYGGVIQRPGLFVYRLVYDPDTQRHNIVGLPRSEALEYVVLGSAAQSIWYMTSAAVTDRQTDLREGTEGSVWMKVSGEYSKRDVASTIGAYADTFAIDNSYKLYAGSLMAGMDFITGHSGGYDYVLGAQIGYVGSTFDLDASTSSGQFTGATGGVYGSIWDGALFVDGTLNTNFLTLDYDSPGIGSKTTTWLRSVGAQLEGGRRFMLTDKIFAEPLATVAFVNTVFEEISLDGGEVTPDKAGSRRAALGLRLGADMFGGPLKVRYYVTGRAWNEFEGENQGAVFNPGAALPFAEDTSGSFGEAQAGLSLFNDDQTIAGFLSSGVKFKDGYNAVDLDLGLRLRW